MHSALLAFFLAVAPVWASGTASPKPPPPPAVDFSTLPASASVRPPSPDRPHPVIARLIADYDVIDDTTLFRLGVLLEQQPGWHTYWKSPGDVGQPTEITWKLPDGSTAEPYEYPVPQRFEDTGIVSFGYEDQVLLWSQVKLPEGLVGPSVEVGAHVQWLVCEVNCIPGQADLSLPLARGKPMPGEFSALFNHYGAQHPTPLASVHDFGAEAAIQAPALRPEEPFRLEIHLAPTAGTELGKPPAEGLWPVFTPIVTPDLFVTATRVNATPDGGLLAVVEGETLAVDPLPTSSRLGGLFQVNVGGKTVRTEVTTDATWVEKGASLTPAEPVVPSAATPVETGASASVAKWLGFAFVGGLLLNIMPCVLPVLLLKVLGLVDIGTRSPRKRHVAGLAYTLGILASFAVLAGIVIALRAAAGSVGWGFQFQYPPYVAALGAIVFAFGLSLFGVFEIPVVGANTAAEASNQEGPLGHFMMGAFATLLGTPCSAPFLGPAMGFAFTQPPFFILLFFCMAGLGLAAPFLAIALVPALARLLPKPGAWMETFKKLLGFMLMATTVWLVDVLAAQVGREGTTGYLAFLATLGVACWIFGHWGGLGETGSRQLLAAGTGLVLAFGGGYRFLVFDSLPASACENASISTENLDYSAKIPWQPFSEQSVAAVSGRPVFIDFTADWCLTCKVNEKSVIETAAVREAMATYGIVPLKADWTRRDPVIGAWLARYQRAAVPFYLVLPADAKTAAMPLGEMVTTEMLVDSFRTAAGK